MDDNDLENLWRKTKKCTFSVLTMPGYYMHFCTYFTCIVMELCVLKKLSLCLKIHLNQSFYSNMSRSLNI